MTLTPIHRGWLVLAGFSGACAVAAEAFARHVLLPSANAYGAELVLIATRFQGVHALALVATLGLLLACRTPAARFALHGAGWLFSAGLVLFCGGLLAKAGGILPDALGRLVPLGGSSLVFGWLSLALAAGLWRASPAQATAASEPPRTAEAGTRTPAAP
jgi:uncharacterized membrane protein YgdD (TMEM256/DUF423 family)